MLERFFRPPLIVRQDAFDRLAGHRADAGWVASAMTRPDARIAAFVDLDPAVEPGRKGQPVRLRWLAPAQAREIGVSPEAVECVLLGAAEDGAPLFAMFLKRTQLDEGAAAQLSPTVDLRSLALQGFAKPEHLALAAQARSLGAWIKSARFCGRCGGATMARDAGWRRHCPSCGLDAYPRSDPAVIMAVTHGDCCLIAHERRFPDRFYSVLAGFVEPGDDIETAVRRETMEETGVRVGAVRYLGSQHWPFPHALMIGCHAEALTTKLTPDPAELTDARWASRAELRAMLEGRHPEGHTLPPAISMAHSLIRAFVDGVGGPGGEP